MRISKSQRDFMKTVTTWRHILNKYMCVSLGLGFLLTMNTSFYHMIILKLSAFIHTLKLRVKNLAYYKSERTENKLLRQRGLI